MKDAANLPDWAVLPLNQGKLLIGNPSRSKTYALIREGKIEARRDGRRTHLVVGSLRKYAEAMATKAAA